MKNIKYIICFVLAILNNSDALAKIKPKIWIGIWDYELNYQGAYQVDSIWFENIPSFMVECIYNLIESNKQWHYVLISKDSMEIIHTNNKMKKIGNINYELKWRYDHNSMYSYMADSKSKPIHEFLPDGKWLYFSTEKDAIGIYRECMIKDHQIFKYVKSYDLKTGLAVEYFEVENGLLNGIVYFDNSTCWLNTERKTNHLKSILRYKDGVRVEILYDRKN